MGAEFHIFGSPGKDEMRKWTYLYWEVLAEQVWTSGSTDSGTVYFRSLGFKAAQKCGSATSHP